MKQFLQPKIRTNSALNDTREWSGILKQPNNTLETDIQQSNAPVIFLLMKKPLGCHYQVCYPILPGEKVQQENTYSCYFKFPATCYYISGFTKKWISIDII